MTANLASPYLAATIEWLGNDVQIAYDSAMVVLLKQMNTLGLAAEHK